LTDNEGKNQGKPDDTNLDDACGCGCCGCGDAPEGAADGEQVGETPWELAGVDDGNEPGGADVYNNLSDEPDISGERNPAGVLAKYRIPAIGEVVSRRHPVLIVVVLLFALLMAAVPFLIHLERNLGHEAFSVYTRICGSRASGRITDDWLKTMSGPTLLSKSSAERAAFVAGIECLPQQGRNFDLRLVKGRAFGRNRAYVLSVYFGDDVRDVEKADGHVANFFFPLIDGKLVIDEMPADRK